MEPIPHARHDEFSEQFTSVLYENWSEILQVVRNRGSSNPGMGTNSCTA